MARSSRPRGRQSNDGVESLVRRIVKEPVKEAVREAIAEDREGASAGRDPSTGEGGGSRRRSRIRRAIPPMLGIALAALAYRRRRRSSGADYESDVGGTSGEDGGGDPIHVEQTSEE